MPIHFAVPQNFSPYAPSRSRSKYRGALSHGKASKSCRAVHSAVGLEVTAKWMGIREVLTAPRSPWQNAYAERLIGSIRRECLDHVIVFHETGLRRILKGYFEYYERC